MLLVDAAHKRSGRRKDFIYENEDGLLRRELDSLTNDIDKLSHCEVGRNKIFLLVDRGDIALLDLLADDLQENIY